MIDLPEAIKSQRYDDDDLARLLKFIKGELITGLPPGLYTYPKSIDNPMLHQACLELEGRGTIKRKIDNPDYILWMPSDILPRLKRGGLLMSLVGLKHQP